ncbi:cation:dicarboxylate symporter family transporter [Roseomonas gilardii]|uniref:cation:dicarboxylate symporter family transporter n=1 Tax=Roseomonas gilardii TaxID=257708 RepID=UPI0021B591B8|nr:cation:dicarboxylase symporter family transporter [Roseomonas gilardii]
MPTAGATSSVQAPSLTLRDFVAHLVPVSIFDAMARNEILQIVVFSLLFGVPRDALVVSAATLSTFNIPEAGPLLIIGIDQFLDMGRSATNFIGNSLAAVGTAAGHLRRGRNAGGRHRPGGLTEAALSGGRPSERARFRRAAGGRVSSGPARRRARGSGAPGPSRHGPG